MELTFTEISYLNESINHRINHINNNLLPLFDDNIELKESYLREVFTIKDINKKLNNLHKQKLQLTWGN